MPITTVAELRAAILEADLPDRIRQVALTWLDTDPNPPATLDDNALRAWFWFGPIELRQYAPAILSAGQPSRRRVIRLRVNEQEYAAISQEAEDAGMTLSEYIRSKAIP